MLTCPHCMGAGKVRRYEIPKTEVAWRPKSVPRPEDTVYVTIVEDCKRCKGRGTV